MRRLLGVLRDDEPDEQPLEPQPSLERLDDLLARVNAAGIPVSIEIDGDHGSWPTEFSSPSSGSPRRRSRTRSSTPPAPRARTWPCAARPGRWIWR